MLRRGVSQRVLRAAGLDGGGMGRTVTGTLPVPPAAAALQQQQQQQQQQERHGRGAVC